MLPPHPGEVREGFLEREPSLEGWEVAVGRETGDGERGES